jgi:hypothetical protein
VFVVDLRFYAVKRCNEETETYISDRKTIPTMPVDSMYNAQPSKPIFSSFFCEMLPSKSGRNFGDEAAHTLATAVNSFPEPAFIHSAGIPRRQTST